MSKSSLLHNFKLGTETALARAGFLRTTKIEVLQAFVMYLVRIFLLLFLFAFCILRVMRSFQFLERLEGGCGQEGA